jgi:UDP-2,3-diacylglucosamine hydrolase
VNTGSAVQIPLPDFFTLQAPTHWRCIDLISDLHLHAQDEATCVAWENYILTTPADAVLMLGDVFEVWVGDDAALVAGSFEAGCAAVLRAAAQHKALYFMHGNRDFLVGEAFLRSCGVQFLVDPCVVVFGGQRSLLTHGDALCLNDVDYMAFRAMVRTPDWQSAFLAKPLAERQMIARGLRAQSEARKATGAAYADVDAPAALAWLQAAQAQRLIHGHTHRPADHAIGPAQAQTPNGSEQPALRHVLSDWDMQAKPARAQVLRLAMPLQPPRPEALQSDHGKTQISSTQPEHLDVRHHITTIERIALC